MSKVIRIEINDALLLSSGFLARADYTCILYLRVPDGWLNGERLAEPYQEAVLEHLYGKNWRQGNEDGSSYRVLGMTTTILDKQALADRVWQQHDRTDRRFQYWFYHVSDNGTIESKEQAQFNQ